MVGWFAPPCSTSGPSTAAQVRGAVEGCVVGRGDETCGGVSGNFLPRPPVWSTLATNASASSSLAALASTRRDWRLRCIAVLGRFRVEGKAAWWLPSGIRRHGGGQRSAANRYSVVAGPPRPPCHSRSRRAVRPGRPQPCVWADERGGHNRRADQQPEQLRVAETQDHHDQRQSQPDPDVALLQRRELAGDAAEGRAGAVQVVAGLQARERDAMPQWRRCWAGVLTAIS